MGSCGPSHRVGQTSYLVARASQRPKCRCQALASFAYLLAECPQLCVSLAKFFHMSICKPITEEGDEHCG